ncbi:hypothetical protein B0H14DRAFT_2652573 [Mycena olivaceomarginata]|nr:hypothetical protein B0H14DRAFT_2652573 [Mycena olivaceomarginata]
MVQPLFGNPKESQRGCWESPSAEAGITLNRRRSKMKHEILLLSARHCCHYPGHRVAGYLTQRPMHYPGTASLGIRPSTRSTPLSIDSAPIMAIQAPNGYGVTVNRQCPYQTNYGHSDSTKYSVKGHSCFNNYRVKGYSTLRAVGAAVNRQHPYQNKNNGPSGSTNTALTGYSTQRSASPSIDGARMETNNGDSGSHHYRIKGMVIQAPQIRRHRVFDPAPVGVIVKTLPTGSAERTSPTGAVLFDMKPPITVVHGSSWPDVDVLPVLSKTDREGNRSTGKKPKLRVVSRAHCDSEVGEVVGTEKIAQPLAEIIRNGLSECRQLPLPG